MQGDTDTAPGYDHADRDDREREARRALEAIVMVAESPADPQLLGELLELAPGRIDQLLAELAAEYEADQRGFSLVRVAGGWRYQSHESASAYVERFVLSGQSARLSAAALETLAIVAYKQPISRAQVAAIRGVNVDGVVRTLSQRGYIAEVGVDPGPGQATLFGTTSLFLERLGLDSLDELPSLGDFIPDADVVELLEHGLRLDDDGDGGDAISDDSASTGDAASGDDTLGADAAVADPDTADPDTVGPAADPDTADPDTAGPAERSGA